MTIITYSVSMSILTVVLLITSFYSVQAFKVNHLDRFTFCFTIYHIGLLMMFGIVFVSVPGIIQGFFLATAVTGLAWLGSFYIGEKLYLLYENNGKS